LTPREFDAIDAWDENYRYELIHGVLVVAALPLPMEAGPNETLGVWLANYQMRGGAMDATLPEQHVRTSDGRRRADRLIWVGLGRYPNVKRDLPSVVVEFVSASKKGPASNCRLRSRWPSRTRGAGARGVTGVIKLF
jgi:hypothetical protein